MAAKLVTVDGRIRTVNRRTDPDLLWALRGGGGGNFGVATELTLRLHRIPPAASYFFVSWPWSSASQAIEAWLAWAPHARDELTSILHLDAGGSSPKVRVSGQYLGPAGDFPGVLGPLNSVPGAHVSAGGRDYLGLQLLFAGCSTKTLTACHTQGTRPGGTLPRMSFNAKSDYLAKPLSASGRAALIGAVERGSSGSVLFDSYGGAINRVAPHATAFVHRQQLCAIQYYGGDGTWIKNTHAAMRPYVSGMAYQNYIDHDLANWRQAYYGSNYRRLVAVQRRLDPHHILHFPQAIGS
jgi:hypothetical protein